jgi:hypothetical protein
MPAAPRVATTVRRRPGGGEMPAARHRAVGQRKPAPGVGFSGNARPIRGLKTVWLPSVTLRYGSARTWNGHVSRGARWAVAVWHGCQVAQPVRKR